MEEKQNQPNESQKWIIISEWNGKCNRCADAKCELYKCNISIDLYDCHKILIETYNSIYTYSTSKDYESTTKKSE